MRLAFQTLTFSGTELSFRVENDQCVIASDGEVIARQSTDAMTLGRALKRYLQLIEESGGALRVSEALHDSSAQHPHAG